MSTTLKAAGTLAAADPDVELGSQSNATFDGMFDEAQQELIFMFENHTKSLIEDVDPYVRRAFLSSVPELCMFFGTAESNDIILTHLNTYLNDRDWMLKCAFFDTIVGIGAFMGSVSLEEFILPLMIQALTDTEEFVVQGALLALAQLAGLGLLSKSRLWELADVVARFSMHPNIWVRESAANFLSAAATYVSPADVKCILLPVLSPFLKTTIMPTDFTELVLLDTLKKPLSRSVFDQALVWAIQSDKGLFWKAMRNIADFHLALRLRRPTERQKSCKVKISAKCRRMKRTSNGSGDFVPSVSRPMTSLNSWLFESLYGGSVRSKRGT